jgi:hypothetical protein
MPVSRNRMMTAVSRRSTKLVPLHTSAGHARRRSAARRQVVLARWGACVASMWERSSSSAIAHLKNCCSARERTDRSVAIGQVGVSTTVSSRSPRRWQAAERYAKNAREVFEVEDAGHQRGWCARGRNRTCGLLLRS